MKKKDLEPRLMNSDDESLDEEIRSTSGDEEEQENNSEAYNNKAPVHLISRSPAINTPNRAPMPTLDTRTEEYIKESLKSTYTTEKKETYSQQLHRESNTEGKAENTNRTVNTLNEDSEHHTPPQTTTSSNSTVGRHDDTEDLEFEFEDVFTYVYSTRPILGEEGQSKHDSANI